MSQAFGKIQRALRIRVRINFEQFAEATGMTAVTVMKIEGGAPVPGDCQLHEKWADVLMLPVGSTERIEYLKLAAEAVNTKAHLRSDEELNKMMPAFFWRENGEAYSREQLEEFRESQRETYE